MGATCMQWTESHADKHTQTYKIKGENVNPLLENINCAPSTQWEAVHWLKKERKKEATGSCEDVEQDGIYIIIMWNNPIWFMLTWLHVIRLPLYKII